MKELMHNVSLTIFGTLYIKRLKSRSTKCNHNFNSIRFPKELPYFLFGAEHPQRTYISKKYLKSYS